MDKMAQTVWCILLLSLPMRGFAACPPDAPSKSSTMKMEDLDSIAGSGADADTCAEAAEAQEADFQKDLNSLFDDAQQWFDTSQWNTAMINAGHFDSETWPDTAKIALVDTAMRLSYVHPFKNCVTSNFGKREWVWHYGVDIRLSKRDSVRAALNGRVRIIKNDRHGYGRVVVLRHLNGLETLYGHLCKELVAQNQEVRAGQVIGLGGSTGRSTGPHLHYEMRFFGEPFDPNKCIDFERYELRADTLTLTKADFAYLVEERKAVWHIVRRGETLGHLARWYHTTIAKICEMNALPRTRLLKVGRKLLVRAAPQKNPSFSFSPATDSASQAVSPQ
jgi:hypothetical protein